MRSQLTDASISNINDGNWVAKYVFNDNGDMAYRTIQSSTGTFSYNGHQMTGATGDENFTLDYDENGNMIENASAKTLEYNWDNKLRCAKDGSDTILTLRYDPAGNRIWKERDVGGPIGAPLVACKYIVDIVGDLPTVLLEINPTNSSIVKTYIYANNQIIAQHNGSYSTPRYFYLHDRLVSVRQVIDVNGTVKNYYTYDPFGKMQELGGTLANYFRFAGQYYDTEIGQYYLRARQYDPYISRFISRDPVFGKFEEPMTFHRYLYCFNNPINLIDPAGLWGTAIHNQIIMAAFPEFMFVSPPENPYEDMFYGSAWVDQLKFQDPEHAYMHAMTNAKTNQSVEEAKEQMYGFIWQNYCLYKQYKNLWKEHWAYNYLGRAMHPIMDSTCPSHNWQPWGGTLNDLWEHHDPKTIDEKTLRDTVSQIQDTIKWLDINYEVSQILMMGGLI